MSFDWGIKIPSQDKRLCDKYNACVIPFYECDFSIMDLHLPFSSFEVDVLNHLVVAPS